MLALAGELPLQTHVVITSLYDILCIHVLQAQVETTGGYNLTHTNDSLTTKDASFHVKSSKTVISYKPSCYSIFVHKNMYVRHLRLYYTPNDHFTTNNASLVQVEINYDFLSATQYVNPFITFLQQIQCTVYTTYMYVC